MGYSRLVWANGNHWLPTRDPTQVMIVEPEQEPGVLQPWTVMAVLKPLVVRELDIVAEKLAFAR